MHKPADLVELTSDELDLVSGGAVGIGIAYGFSSDGKAAQIKWTDGKNDYTMTSGQVGVLVTTHQ